MNRFRALAAGALLSAVLLATNAAQAAPYSPAQAAAHIGEVATIAGPVSGTHVDNRSGAGFIDMGGRYPNHAFQGFVPRGAMGQFGDLHRYDGKTVSITGEIKDYKGRPEIVLSDPSQIDAR